MAINLPDLPQAVRAYLNGKVTVTVSSLTPASGESINPGEAFSYRVRVVNASAAAGGILLINVRYAIRVADSGVVRIRVPSGGTSLGLGGESLSAGSEVGFFEFNPSSPEDSILQIGETEELSFTGRAASSPQGGSTTISAKILADPDLNALFPRNEDSGTATRTVTVVG